MITSKKELKFYIMADYMMNRGYFSPPFIKKLAHIFNPDIVMEFIISMRRYSYYSKQGGYFRY